MFPIETISAKMLDYYVGRSDALIIDLRDTVSYHKSHVKGAVNVPYGELENGYAFPKEKMIVFYNFIKDSFSSQLVMLLIRVPI